MKILFPLHHAGRITRIFAFFFVGMGFGLANDFSDPHTNNPGITSGTVLSFSGGNGQSITLTAVKGDQESLYPNQSSSLTITPGSTYNGQALVAYTYSMTAHAEDYEGGGIDNKTAAGYGTIYEVPAVIGRGKVWSTSVRSDQTPSNVFTGFFQYSVGTSTHGQPVLLGAITGPLPAGSILDALLNGASTTPDYTKPMDFIGDGEGQIHLGSWAMRAQVIINEIDVTITGGIYKYKRYVPTWEYAGSNNVGQHIYGIYVPVNNKLYFAGDPRAILTDPIGNIVTPNNANGFYEIDNVVASRMGISGVWPNGNQTGEAAQPGFYMAATSPQLAPLISPTGTIASPSVVRQGTPVAVTFSVHE